MLDLFGILTVLTIFSMLAGTACMTLAIRRDRRDRCPSCHEVGLHGEVDSDTWTCSHCDTTSDSGLAPLAHSKQTAFVFAWICLFALWLMWLIMYLVVMV
jgi:ribosomal protein L37AE/L43A